MTELQFTTKPYHKRTTPVVCKIDTGAELNVTSKKDFECLFPEKERKLEKPSCKITSYGGHGIANLGKCQLYARHKGQVKEITFNVTEVSGPAIIGCKTCDYLELVKYTFNLEKVSEFPPPSQHDDTHTILTKGKLVNNFKDRFEGLGTFHMKPYHITLKEGAEPVIHLRDLYKQQIDQMLEADIIAPVDTPTDWVNSIVLSETTDDKGNIAKIRVCLDP